MLSIRTRNILRFLLILTTPCLFLNCSGNDDQSQSISQEPISRFVEPTLQQYVEAEDDPDGHVVFNGFSTDEFVVNEERAEENFIVSWDIAYRNELFKFFVMQMFLVDKDAIAETEWKNGKYIGKGIKLSEVVVNNPRNYGTYQFTYHYIDKNLLMKNDPDKRSISLDLIEENIYLLCVGYTQIYHQDNSFSYFKAHRLLKLELHDF